MNFFDKFLKIDRRYIFILVAIGVVIPLVFPLGLAVTVSPPVKNVYDEIENLKPGTPVLVSVDFDPSTEPELGPMTAAVLRHCFSRDLKVIGMTFWVTGVGLGEKALADIAGNAGRQSDERVHVSRIEWQFQDSAVVYHLAHHRGGGLQQ